MNNNAIRLWVCSEITVIFWSRTSPCFSSFAALMPFGRTRHTIQYPESIVDNYLVKDLMVPISEYATVSEGATLFDAYLALEKAQEEYDHNKYRHRGVLVLNQDGRVTGKIGQMDVLRALEPNSEQVSLFEDIRKYGFSDGFIIRLRERSLSQREPLADICKKAGLIKVEELMQTPTEGECIDENAPFGAAIHQIVRGSHLALLVTREREIIGILRLTDVFAAIFHTMKECSLSF